MSLPTKQYPPPGTWDEFESLCADLYELVWKDPATDRVIRHVRRSNRSDNPFMGILGGGCFDIGPQARCRRRSGLTAVPADVCGWSRADVQFCSAAACVALFAHNSANSSFSDCSSDRLSLRVTNFARNMATRSQSARVGWTAALIVTVRSNRHAQAPSGVRHFDMKSTRGGVSRCFSIMGYMRVLDIKDDMIVFPARRYQQTENNLGKNDRVQLLVASKKVQGTRSPGVKGALS